MKYYKVETCDYDLFKDKNYDLLMKKYQPLIYTTTCRYFSYLSRDASIEFEDVLQFNNMIAWEKICKTEKLIKERNFNKGMRFGIILKLELKSYCEAKIKKQKDFINQNLISFPLDSFDYENLLYSHDNSLSFQKDTWGVKYETEEMYDEFQESLTSVQKNFMQKLMINNHLSIKQLAIKFKMKEFVVRYQRTSLKKKFLDFSKKSGYNLQRKL
jgi:hypothetical protein